MLAVTEQWPSKTHFIRKAECQRIDAFKLWCWRKLLRVLWTARRSNQSILKKINPEYSLEGLMLKLKLQYIGHLMRRADSLEKTLMLGKIESRRRRGWQRKRFGWHHQFYGHEFERSKFWEMVKDREAWGAAVHGVSKSWTRLRDWTTAAIVWLDLGCLFSLCHVRFWFLSFTKPFVSSIFNVL